MVQSRFQTAGKTAGEKQMAQMKFTQCGCGNQVSHDSSRCPKCGGKVKHPTSSAAKLIAAFCAILVCVILFALSATNPSKDFGPPANEHQTAGEIANIKASAKADRHLVEAAMAYAKIKQNAIDPDSVKLKSALIVDSGAVCYTLSLTNAYGGRIENWAVLTPKGMIYAVDLTGINNDKWNRYCGNKEGFENAEVISRLAGQLDGK
jgi:hypothetical protein